MSITSFPTCTIIFQYTASKKQRNSAPLYYSLMLPVWKAYSIFISANSLNWKARIRMCWEAFLRIQTWNRYTPNKASLLFHSALKYDKVFALIIHCSNKHEVQALFVQRTSLSFKKNCFFIHLLTSKQDSCWLGWPAWLCPAESFSESVCILAHIYHFS